MNMPEKPELIVFSQNLLGGGASFHRNMLAHFPTDFFTIRCIYLNPVNWNGAKALDVSLNQNDEIFSFGNEPQRKTAKRLSKLIADTEGVVVANLQDELISLDLYPRHRKTIFFICHDDGFIDLAVKYKNIIDVFIAHNIAVYDSLKALMNKRQKDIYFIQHGVNIPEFERGPDKGQDLKVIFLARHYEFKGLYDLPKIDALLQEKGVKVEWTILGDGPERAPFAKSVEQLPNFRFFIPPTPAAVLDILKEQDVFILPSRKDGLPVALLESMSVGCVPVIANFSDGIKKVVTDDIGFVLPVGENSIFAEKIALLSRDRMLLRSLSDNCLKKVKKEFDIKKQAMEYYHLYKNFKQLRKRHFIRWADIYRKAEYYNSLNKVIHISRQIKTRLNPGNK
jgi:glycosyltransferase involved in cell wall biosynthesis